MDANERELDIPKGDATDDEGEQGWDTQYCQRLQDELLSSSPRNSQPASTRQSSGNHDDSYHGDDDASDHGNESIADDTDDVTVCFQVGGLDLGALEAKSPAHQQSCLAAYDSTSRADIEDGNGRNLTIDPKAIKLSNKHDNHIGTGENAVLPATRAKMDGFTQPSSLSPTQENPASVYAQYACHTSADADAISKGASDQPQLNSASHEPLQAKHHSTVTDSTIHTYGENDTGHVNFDGFAIGENPEGNSPEREDPEREDSLSQDASFAPRVDEPLPERYYDPETPAPPVNPFSQKGTVMRSHEMFKATQPSSIGRHMLSATSSRPSPDVYNDFTSPAKWMPPSSPLVRRYEPVESSPLQSSVRSLLGSKRLVDHAASLQVAGTKSLGSGPGSSPRSSMHQPLEYISMKESQERRQKETSSSSADSDTESDSDLDDISTKRQRKRRQREEELQRQMSSVELCRNLPVSSRPISPSPGEVEVPSTSNGIRRSVRGGYAAHCAGSDARDTQQDDIVADSQTIQENPVESGEERVPASPKVTTVQHSLPSNTGESNVRSSSGLPAHSHDKDLRSGPGLDPNSNGPADTASNEPSSPPIQPSLPLKEVSTNRNDLKTSSATKPPVSSDGVDITVPETSPAEDRIRPVGDIANISFGDNDADELQGLPGFTQDSEFERAIMPRLSPEPAPRRVRNRRGGSHPALAPSATETASPAGPIAPASAPPERGFEVTSAAGRHESTTSNHNDINSLERPGSRSANLGENPVEGSDAPAKRGGTAALADKFISGPTPVPGRKEGLRSKDELKGPSRSLRRSGPDAHGAPLVTPKQPPPATKLTPATKTDSTRSSKAAIPSSPAPPSSLSSVSTPRSVITRSLSQKAREATPLASQGKGKSLDQSLPALQPGRSSKRKLGAADETNVPSRDSKRRSINGARDSSVDPLCLPHPPPACSMQRQQSARLFANMAFAVSYLGQQDEKDAVNSAIAENGGWILEEGFAILFESGPSSKSRPRSGIVEDLTLSAAARPTGFVALIADEHSRRVKYMQALALGLPCISGKWILECMSRDEIVDWSAYLLCAGLSSFLGNAIRSRTLQPYPATEAAFSENFAIRKQFLEGKSILAVTGKGSTAEKRQHYLFLMRVLGPSRLVQVADMKQARKTLLDSQQSWDLVYVGDSEKHAADALFGQAPSASAASKKRKKGPTPSAADPAPERVRIISDEVVIQSLILGQLL